MYKRLKYYIATTLMVLLMITTNSHATHIRAGEIIVELIGGLTVKIKIIAYTDKGSRILFGNGILDFGDGSDPINLDDFINANNTGRVKLTETTIGSVGNQPVGLAHFETTHNYPGTGIYHITYTEQNRNADIRNMTNSVNTTFHIETKFEITNDPFFGINSSPILTTPPLEEAATGVAYYHNPGAYDIDGDSLSYHLVTPLKNKEIEVDNYRYPNDPRFYGGLDYNKSNEKADGQPALTIDPITGLLTWDAPGEEGEYNIAFIVKEWRKSKLRGWINLGFVRRDMQIIVIQGNNKRPTIELENVCVIAGEKIHQAIKTDDPDGHNIRITALGEILNGKIQASICSEPTTFGRNCNTKGKLYPTPAIFYLDWQTNCNLIRKEPYKVTIKVVDEPPPASRPKLTAFETMQVRIIGPAPENLIAKINTNYTAKLNWDKYKCINADSIKIYRKIGEYDYTHKECETGLPSQHTYTKIKSIPLYPSSNEGDTNQTQNIEYIDNNDDDGLEPGVKYCYRIMASYDTIKGGDSIVSNESCITIESRGPIITKVDVQKTHKTEGVVDIAWINSPKLDITTLAGPVKYKVYREGVTSEDNILVTTTDKLTFIDTGLDTTLPSLYQIEIVDSYDKTVERSATASTVSQFLIPREDRFFINYRAVTPWALQTKDHPTHKIYRSINSEVDPNQGFELLSTFNVFENGFNYIDESKEGNILAKNTNYCYYIETYGSYEQKDIPSPLVNKSPITCNVLADKDAECGSIDIAVSDCKSYLGATSCDINKTVNTILWTYTAVINCETDVEKFKILFSNKKDGDYVHRAEVDAIVTIYNDYVDKLGGCYKVAAVDKNGNISSLSEGHCVDKLQECTNYMLPNVFTPNGDGKNDVFEPLKTQEQCPRFVKKLSFNVYDRFGNKVYGQNSSAEKSIIISWNGKSSNGNHLPSGLYYYENDVYFDVINPDFAKKSFKGWIHLLR